MFGLTPFRPIFVINHLFDSSNGLVREILVLEY